MGRSPLSLRRAGGWAAALLGVIVLASIPGHVVRSLRDRAAEPAGDVVNGTVGAVTRVDGQFVATVDYLAWGVPAKLETDAGRRGLFSPRPRLQVGDPVLVVHDAHGARLMSPRLWPTLVVRGAGGLLLLALAAILGLGPRASLESSRPAALERTRTARSA